MGITHFECGCSIAKSMFGEREILWVNTCVSHTTKLQPELKDLAEKVANIAIVKPTTAS